MGNVTELYCFRSKQRINSEDVQARPSCKQADAAALDAAYINVMEQFDPGHKERFPKVSTEATRMVWSYAVGTEPSQDIQLAKLIQAAMNTGFSEEYLTDIMMGTNSETFNEKIDQLSHLSRFKVH